MFPGEDNDLLMYFPFSEFPENEFLDMTGYGSRITSSMDSNYWTTTEPSYTCRFGEYYSNGCQCKFILNN
jgi:hypothetical protein